MPSSQCRQGQENNVQICGWSYDNKVNINTKKTKEMLLGSVSKGPPPLITINNSPVERVQSFELLGVLLTSSLSWSEHITVCTKASKRLYFLKLLKRSGMTFDDLLYYYKTVIRVRRVCCLAFKYHSRTARPIGGNTAASSSDYLWQRNGF